MDLIKLHKIKEFALQTMKEWDLIEKNWKFVWDTRAVRRYGQCRYGSKEIGITKKLADINTTEETKDVVLHEIAHALAGREHGHDYVWKSWCRKVGARPQRCYKAERNGGTVKTLKGKYILVNKSTGQIYKTYYRRPKRMDWSTRWIGGKKSKTLGQLAVRSI